MLALLLASLTLVGCIDTLHAAVYAPTPPLPQPPPPPVIHESKVLDNVSIEAQNATISSFDGVALHALVVRANVTTPIPTLVVLGPTWGAVRYHALDLNSTLSTTPQSVWLATFAPRGYAVAFVDVRGTGESGGCFDLGGATEQKDAAAVVEWAAKQPWSDGHVGMIGMGYEGATALEAAAQKAPHLAAIAVIDPITNWYGMLATGGARYKDADQLVVRENADEAMGLPLAVSSDPNVMLMQVPKMDDSRVARASAQGCVAQNAQGMEDQTGAPNAWTRERDLRSTLANASVPLFYTANLLDQVHRADQMSDLYHAYAGAKTAYVWQAEGSLFGTTLPVLPGDTVAGALWQTMLLRWFDHHLLGLDNGIESSYGKALVQDDLGRWRNDTAWPSANATPRAWLLGPGGVLAENATPAAGTTSLLPTTETPDAWRDDRMEDGGPLGTRTTVPAQGSTATRLVFRSDALTADAHASGRPLVRVHVSTDKPNALVVARLYDVLPDGSWVLVDRGAQSIALRDGASFQPAAPGTVYDITVQLQPDDYVFAAGHRIGLVLAGADAAFLAPTAYEATTTLHYAGEPASALVLPIVQDGVSMFTTWDSQQPAWRGPQAWRGSS